jgi:hypothetical protein
MLTLTSRNAGTIFRSEERTESIMRNNYEASEVFEFGKAHEVVLGQKPTASELDSVYGLGRQEIPDDLDIDESE